MSGTQPRELLTCLCGAFFAVYKEEITIEVFQDWLNKFLKQNLGPDDKKWDDLKNHLGKTYNKQQIIAKISPINKKDEISSAFNTISLLKEKLNLNFSDYNFYHQESDFVKVVKEDATKKVAKILGDTSFKSDRYTPADIYLVHTSHEDNCKREYNNHIINEDESTIIKNMAHGDLGKHTYRTITNSFLKDRKVIPVSLKKESGKLKLSFVGTLQTGLDTNHAEKLSKEDIDPFTRFMGYLLEKNLNYITVKSEINNIIDITDVKIRSDTAHFIVKADFKYNKIPTLKDISSIPIEMEIRQDNSFNTKERGKNYGGGMTFKITFDYLRKNEEILTKINSLKKEINKITINFFKKIVKPQQKLDNDDYTKIRKLKDIFQKNDILYLKKHFLEIENVFGDKQIYINFIKFMIESLYRKDFVTNIHQQDKLENILSKMQVVTFFMDRKVENQLKELIFFFVYGLTTKKMHGVLVQKPNSNLVQLVQAYQVVYEKIIKNKLIEKKYVGYTTAPYILIS